MPRKAESKRFPVRIKLIVATLLILLLGACSRPPKTVQNPAKAAADATLKLAQNLEKKQRLLDSGQTYESALNQYRRFADLRGEAYCLAGLARLACLQGSFQKYQQLREELAYLVENADSTARYVLTLLDIFAAQKQEDYRQVKLLAVDSYDYPQNIRMQILSHALQADSWLAPGLDSAAYEDLSRLSKSYRKSLKRDFCADASVLSGALYAMAYHSYLKKNHYEALRHISEAVDIDEKSENFPALGYDLWLRANIHLGEREQADAISNLIRAQKIFAGFSNLKMLEKTEAQLMQLQGD